MPLITFVTTCRGRLAHVRETLPLLVAQHDAAVVVVDYGCPDRTGDWIEAHFPSVVVARAPDAPRFEVARARNLGAAQVQTPWICLIDADIRVRADFCARVEPLLVEKRFYMAEPRTGESWGTCICPKADFDAIGGYDEVLQSWGKEDEDLYSRLVLAGVSYDVFPGELIDVISHDDSERVAHFELKDRWFSESINHVYCRAKIDLMQLQRQPMNLDDRKRLYAQVRSAVIAAYESGEPMNIGLVFMTQETRTCGPLECKLLYTLPRPRGEGRPLRKTSPLIYKQSSVTRDD
jgi:glycosyltransferase involved in cell wall biosynthesis